eukprot:1158039-Pelagomonas_calceolata.AAC.7
MTLQLCKRAGLSTQAGTPDTSNKHSGRPLNALTHLRQLCEGSGAAAGQARFEPQLKRFQAREALQRLQLPIVAMRVGNKHREVLEPQVIGELTSALWMSLKDRPRVWMRGKTCWPPKTDRGCGCVGRPAGHQRPRV